jgi:hypothetical protein
MKTNILALIFLFLTLNIFGQNINGKKSTAKPNYTENSEIKVFINDTLNKFHSKKKPAGIFVNGIFFGDDNILNVINSEKIESINIEKENYTQNGKEYYGKIILKMKSGYISKFITLKELITKYLELDNEPIVFQINGDVINQDYNEYLVDENFILKIISKKIKTSDKNIEINLVKLITKTAENIKKANEIRIKGTEI